MTTGQFFLCSLGCCKTTASLYYIAYMHNSFLCSYHGLSLSRGHESAFSYDTHCHPTIHSYTGWSSTRRHMPHHSKLGSHCFATWRKPPRIVSGEPVHAEPPVLPTYNVASALLATYALNCNFQPLYVLQSTGTLCLHTTSGLYIITPC